jgi:hypothetical protein
LHWTLNMCFGQTSFVVFEWLNLILGVVRFRAQLSASWQVEQ